MNMLIITVAVIVWLMAKLVGRSAERKLWLNEIEKRLLEAERRLDYLERQINTNRQAAHIVAAPLSVVASPSSQAAPLFSSPAVCQSKEPNVPGAIPESIPELASRKTLADAKEPLSLTEPAHELTDFFRSKRLVVEEPPARTLMPSSPFEKSWRRFEQMFSENWTGVLGAVVLVAGVTFIRIYTALQLAPLFPENLKEPLPAESRATDCPPGAILLVVFALVGIFGLSTLRNRLGSRKLLLNYRSLFPKK